MQTEIITPEKAQYILENECYSRQRRISQTVVSHYANEITLGRFLKDTVLRFCKFESNLYLVDGQHRLHAVVKANMPLQFQILTIQCETIEDIDTEYSYTDIGKARSPIDQLTAYKISELTGLTHTQVNTLKPAWLIINNQFMKAGGKTSPVELKSGILEWASIMHVFCDVTDKTIDYLDHPMRRSGLVAVALVTLRYQEQSARNFWNMVSHDDGLPNGNPAKALIRHLLLTTVQSGATSGKRESTLDLSKCSARAWNAHFKNEVLFKIMTPNELSIIGTPFES